MALTGLPALSELRHDTSPATAGKTPASVCSKVVLPQPDSPITARELPGCNVKFTPDSKACPRRPTDKSFA